MAKKTLVMPVNVYWDTADVNQQIITEGGVVVKYEPQTVQTFTDETGGNIYDEFSNGAIVGLTVNACEWDLDIMDILFGAASTMTGSGDTAHVEIRANVGTSYRDNAKQVILKGIVGGSEDSTEEYWITLPLCYPKGPGEISLVKDAQFVMATEFTVFPDPDNDNRTHWFGLESGS